MRDIEQWLSIKVRTLKSSVYSTTDEVFEGERFISGTEGARCTRELKRKPRIDYQNEEDVHIFGYTLDETMPLCKRADRDRVANFEKNNPTLWVEWPLVENKILKSTCFKILKAAGLKLPRMYELGFPNANCRGCVKSGSAWYWNRTREVFPETFARRAAISRKLGVRLVKLDGKRIFLDELPTNRKYKNQHEDLSCGPQCVDPNLQHVL